MQSLLNNAANSLLLATFGVSLLLAIRNGESVHRCFEKLAAGYLAILFCGDIFDNLSRLGLELEVFLLRQSTAEDLNSFIGQVLQNAAKNVDPSHPLGAAGNALNYFAQVFRTGVWGILSSITELVFVLARFLLEVARDALWQIALVLFPLSAAFIPIAPKIMLGMFTFILELSLWLPILAIINLATSEVARRYSTISYDFGFYVLALEIVSIMLTASVPMVAHRLVSGSLSGNIAESWKKTLQTGATVVMGIPQLGTLAGAASVARRAANLKAILIFLTAGALLSLPASAAESITLKKGFLKKFPCQGRLYATGIGDESIVDLEALPQNLGCGVILKPIRPGSTNMILETSTGTIERLLSVQGDSVKIKMKTPEVKK